MRKHLVVVMMFLSLWMTSATARAAGKYGIGFNEEWVSSYFSYIGQNCADCPTDSAPPVSYNTIASIILNLVVVHHVGAYREIIPDKLIEQDRVNNYANIIRILSIYSAYNLNLDLTMGLPVAPALSVTGNDFAIMPIAAASWTLLKNNLSWSMGDLIQAMWNSPSISHAWMANRLFVEGFNEFDSVANLAGSTANSTPARAADLNGGIGWVINYYHVVTMQTMFSVVGVYSGYAPGVNSVSQYVKDYYADGGDGFPNVHLYVATPTAAVGVAALRSLVLSVNAVLPVNLRGMVFLGETGNADVTATCSSSFPSAMAPGQRIVEYAAIAADPTINSGIAFETFWRLMTLPPGQVPGLGCESSYGVLDYRSMTYNAVATNLFRYLNL